MINEKCYIHKFTNRWLWLLTAFLISHFSLLICPAMAQDDPEYRLEVGAGLGMTSYEGDFNGSVAKNMQPSLSMVAKYRMNPRSAWAATITYGKLEGKNTDISVQPQNYSFSSTLMDVSMKYEYNFWAYGTGREYYGAKRIAPFLALGLGLTYAHHNKTAMALNVPLGFGVKAKVAERLNLTADWTMHFSGSDELDGIKDPYGIESSGLFKNTDCYSTLQVTLTYDLWAKCKTCNNDRD